VITPAGKECRFYYEDYHRGHSEQYCRLIRGNPNSLTWEAKDCSRCPIPEILRANSSPDLVLEATIKSGLFGLNRRVEVVASCSKHLVEVKKPEVGCPFCAKEKPGLQELFGDDL
jgi:hypothetical protein